MGTKEETIVSSKIIMKKLFCLLFVLLGLISCVDDVVFDRAGERIVVVNCVLKYPAQMQTAKVMYSAAVGAISPVTPVSDAEVSLSDLSDPSKERVVFQYGNNNEGYSAPLSVIPGHKYSLEVKINGRETITSETTVPEARSIKVENRTVSPPYSDYAPLKAYSYDVKDLLGRPFWIYAMNYDEGNKDRMISERLSVTYSGLYQVGDSFVDGFNITSNFIIYSAYTSTPHYLYKKYLRFTGKNDNFVSLPISTIFIDGDGQMRGPYYELTESSAVITPGEEMPDESMGFVVVCVPSEEYDNFLKELFMFMEKKEDMEDLTLLYEMTNMHSNLSGAMGIFGAQVVYYLPWKKPEYSFDF